MEYYVAECYVNPILNGDDDHCLQPTEFYMLDRFFTRSDTGHLECTSDAGEYRRCDISGYMANCYELTTIKG
jgi:hypothetical protein